MFLAASWKNLEALILLALNREEGNDIIVNGTISSIVTFQ